MYLSYNQLKYLNYQSFITYIICIKRQKCELCKKIQKYKGQ